MNNPAWNPRAGLVAAGLMLIFLVLASGVAIAEEDPLPPTISGEAYVGETLVASEAAIYKWQRCDPESASCGGDEGPNGGGWTNISPAEVEDPGSYAITSADLGLLIRVLAKDTNLGTKFAASDPVGPVTAGEEEPPPPEQVPPPTFRMTGNLDPLSGSVLARPPGSQGWVEISELTQVPLGTKVDVSGGRVDLTTERKSAGVLQTVELWGGPFVVNQRRKGVTVMRLVHARSPTGEIAARHRKRRLWGRGRCRCRHRGRNSSGTARGTWWVTVETPKGTVTRVKKGVVAVRDLNRRKRILVRAGERYLARR